MFVHFISAADLQIVATNNLRLDELSHRMPVSLLHTGATHVRISVTHSSLYLTGALYTFDENEFYYPKA